MVLGTLTVSHIVNSTSLSKRIVTVGVIPAHPCELERVRVNESGALPVLRSLCS
jgi:hypothetical protein